MFWDSPQGHFGEYASTVIPSQVEREVACTYGPAASGRLYFSNLIRSGERSSRCIGCLQIADTGTYFAHWSTRTFGAFQSCQDLPKDQHAFSGNRLSTGV